MSRTASTRTKSRVSNRGLQRQTSVKKKRPAPAARAAATLASVPTWASATVFERAKTVAWEGFATPLRHVTVYPETVPFIQNLTQTITDGCRWSDIVHPVDRARVIQFFDTTLVAPAVIDYRVIDLHGAVLWIRHTVDEIAESNGERRIRGFVTDIQTEKEYQLESLRVSEREQNRIGQDLHDDLCQVLAGVSCLMRVFEGRVAAKVPEELPNLKELNDQIIDAMHRTRALTHGLFPGKIQIADIRGALLELASQVKARFKVDISTQFAGRFPKHSAAQIIQVYRISQEAMSNAIKHGHATAVAVRLSAQENAMELTITDNGEGLPAKENATPGVGLNIMKYRAALLGGDVSVANAQVGGVCVTLRYPFENRG